MESVADRELDQSRDWSSESIDNVFEALATGHKGLDDDECRRRQRLFGLNVLPESLGPGVLSRLAAQFASPLIYVLVATAVLTAFLGEWVDASVILAVVIGNAVIGYFQEAKAERAIQSLKGLLSKEATLFRAGESQVLGVESIVVGDIVILAAGDRVPADLRLFEAKDLRIDEASISGESLPVDKSNERLVTPKPVAERSNMAFSGTFVVAGSGRGVAVHTGAHTELGKMADLLQQVEPVRAPLLDQLASFSVRITYTILIFALGILGLGLALGNDFMEMVLIAVALSVSAIPEGLPAIMTVAMAIGVKRMARARAVIRKLPAVESLGRTTVICSDKTGTLTRNEMTITTVRTPSSEYEVEGIGFDPNGQWTKGGEVLETLPEDAGLLIRTGALCNDASLYLDEGRVLIDGDPTEGAFLVAAEKGESGYKKIREQWPRLDVIPFGSAGKVMATLNRDGEGNRRIFVKGAPERVLEMCLKEHGGDESLDRALWNDRIAGLASKGLRVLGLATMKGDPSKETVELADLREGLEWLGIVGMIDPPRREVPAAIAQCQRAGIEVKMITGDHAGTATAIAKELGLGNGQGLTGSELDDIDDKELEERARHVDVFARVSAEHKLRIVSALQARGEIVTMTGDGVNDAAALKRADIGVAMGKTGTEVSQDAADMVLMDDNFASIEGAVEQGRTVEANLRKTLLFILPTNGGECLTLVLAFFFAITLPILPLHILWINLVTTVALALALAFEPPEDDVMGRPPRDPKGKLVDRELFVRFAFVTVLMTAGCFALFFSELNSLAPLEVARTTAINGIVAFEAVYLLNTRFFTRSSFSSRVWSGNPWVFGGIGLVLGLQGLFTYLPSMNQLFGTAPLGWESWGKILIASLVLFVAVEIQKGWARRGKHGARSA